MQMLKKSSATLSLVPLNSQRVFTPMEWLIVFFFINSPKNDPLYHLKYIQSKNGHTCTLYIIEYDNDKSYFTSSSNIFTSP